MFLDICIVKYHLHRISSVFLIVGIVEVLMRSNIQICDVITSSCCSCFYFIPKNALVLIGLYNVLYK
jgi:hypothetical protein